MKPTSIWQRLRERFARGPVRVGEVTSVIVDARGSGALAQPTSKSATIARLTARPPRAPSSLA